MSEKRARPSRAKANGAPPSWPDEIFQVLKDADVRQVCYVPDAGHKRLIERCQADNAMRTVALTTEEEGIALCAGAWLGHERSALLMQSSGVGNCINMLSLPSNCRFPLVMLITMRGEWGEFNPWQVPMGSIVEPVLTQAGTRVFRVERPDEAAETVQAATELAFNGDLSVAVLLSQRMIGRKVWTK
jgi:sulfopyruvate decarboxylase alpha subunit